MPNPAREGLETRYQSRINKKEKDLFNKVLTREKKRILSLIDVIRQKSAEAISLKQTSHTKRAADLADAQEASAHKDFQDLIVWLSDGTGKESSYVMQEMAEHFPSELTIESGKLQIKPRAGWKYHDPMSTWKDANPQPSSLEPKQGPRRYDFSKNGFIPHHYQDARNALGSALGVSTVNDPYHPIPVKNGGWNVPLKRASVRLGRGNCDPVTPLTAQVEATTPYIESPWGEVGQDQFQSIDIQTPEPQSRQHGPSTVPPSLKTPATARGMTGMTGMNGLTDGGRTPPNVTWGNTGHDIAPFNVENTPFCESGGHPLVMTYRSHLEILYIYMHLIQN